MIFDNFLGVMMNDIGQSTSLGLVNSNLYAKFYQNIPKIHETGPGSLLSEFESRQNVDQSQMTFDTLLGYILSISMCMQNFIIIFHSVPEKGPFSFFFFKFGARHSLDR